jgi:hypothetical protein
MHVQWFPLALIIMIMITISSVNGDIINRMNGRSYQHGGIADAKTRERLMANALRRNAAIAAAARNPRPPQQYHDGSDIMSRVVWNIPEPSQQTPTGQRYLMVKNETTSAVSVPTRPLARYLPPNINRDAVPGSSQYPTRLTNGPLQILLLGMHHSGTSLLAGLLNLTGH